MAKPSSRQQLNVATALTRFEEAVREHAFLGAANPADQASIEREYHASKTALMQAISAQGERRFYMGQKDMQSRMLNRPGDGDMGG